MRKLYESSAGDIFSVFEEDYVQIISFTSTSPTGVTCYKCFYIFFKGSGLLWVSVPYRGYLLWINKKAIIALCNSMFPSPNKGYLLWMVAVFQTIVNWICFRPQQGLPIMNMNGIKLITILFQGFRPLQGLIIMNSL